MAKGRAPKDFIPDFSGDVAADFELWLEDVNDYLAICGVTDEAAQKQLFLNLAGLAVRKIVKGLVVPTGGNEYKALTDALKAHFRPAVNTTSERYKFRQLKQLPDESVTSFIGRLRERVELCNFASTSVDTILNSQVRDQLIIGLKSSDIRRELLKESDLTLANASSKAVAMEASFTDSRMYDDQSVGSSPSLAASAQSSIAAVHSSQPKFQKPNKASRNKSSQSAGKSCMYCGRLHAKGKQFCPAAHVRCSKCSKVGHFSEVCLSTQVRVVNEEDVADLAQEVYDLAYAVGPSVATSNQSFTATLNVNGQPCEGLMDTGATRTILTDDIVQPTRSSDRILKAYNRSVIPTLGMADVEISTDKHTMRCSCFVVPKGRQRVLFGQDVISQLELLVTANLVDTAPVSITVDPAATPIAQPARRPPISAKADIEAELQRLVKADVIEPVKEASAWVSPIVPVRKSNGTLRLCVDYRQLNKSIIREHRALPTVDEITAELADAEVFSVLDAESGFHQLLLDVDSRPLTTFATHCGLYRFKRLPFGVSCAPEIFQRVVSDILVGLPGVVVYIDDILVFGRNRKEHDERLASVRARLTAANLKLNGDKCCIGQEQVKYLGHILTKAGVQPDADKLSAIQDMPPPKSLADVQRFLGMVTYLGKFVPQLTNATEPLRTLSKREPFVADSELLSAFATTQQAVATSLHTLAYFRPSPKVPTAVSCDASPLGLGAILWQQDASGQWLPVTCASRTLTDVETRYSQLEREMLGIVFALTRFRQYVLGRFVEVYTDHKPLLSIIRKPFDDVPPRLQRWLVSLMPYDYTLKHVPGKQLACTDTLSRAPLPTRVASSAESRSLHEYIGLVLEASPVDLDDIRRATQADAVLNKVIQRILTSSWKDISILEQPYYVVRDQLTVVDGVILLSARILIPADLRHSVMALAHEGHPGQEAFQDALRQRVWWPGMSKDVTLYMERCSECWRRRTNGPQELLPTEIEGVWEKLAVDLVSIEGRSFLSIIDYGSRFPILRPLLSTTTTAVIDVLDDIFAMFGLPASLVSDNGPQFISEQMAVFLSRLNISHVKSSPRYARSNGMVERLHRVIKERLSALKPHLPFQRRLNQVMFDIRGSRHRMLGTSPSSALFTRTMRTRVPTVITPQVVNASHQLKAKADMADAHDARRGVRPLPRLTPGTQVVVQDNYCDPTQPWTVVDQYGRQVGITNGARFLLRNRQHVREFLSPQKVVTLSAQNSSAPAVTSPATQLTPDASPVPPAVSTPMPALPTLSPSNAVPASSTSSATSTASLLSPSTADSAPSSPTPAGQAIANANGPAVPVTATSRRFYDGVVTSSGRRVNFTEKAKAGLP